MLTTEDPHAFHHAPIGDSPFTISRLLLGAAIGGGAIMLAPHVLPAIGIGSETLAANSETMLHGASGLAGGVNYLLSGVPVVGPQLAEGGLFNAALCGVVGIGGVVLGNHLIKKEAGKEGISWGKLIEYAALATSALIALPTVLSSISSGILYLSQLLGLAAENPRFPPQMASVLQHTLGTTGMAHESMGFTGLAAVIPHVLTCGLPMASAALAYTLPEHPASATAQAYTDGSIAAEVETDKPLVAGTPCRATLRLKHAATGQPLTAEELAVVHTEKIHLFIVDSSLHDYQHVHPQPTAESGAFAFSFIPNSGNNYSAWADFTLLANNQNHKLKTEMPAATGRNIPPSIRVNTSAEQQGMRFEWKSDAPLSQGSSSIVEVVVTDARGNPVNDLEPVMGAFAHLVGFSADGHSIIHTHPFGPEPVHAGDRGGPALRFHVEPDCSGATQFYLQVRRNGENMYVPFGQQIKSPELAAEKASMPQHDIWKIKSLVSPKTASHSHILHG